MPAFRKRLIALCSGWLISREQILRRRQLDVGELGERRVESTAGLSHEAESWCRA